MTFYEDEFDGEETVAGPAPGENPFMVLKVELGSYDANKIVQSLAAEMADHVMRAHREDIQKMARELVGDRVRAELDKAIAPIIEDALGQPLVPTDPFGKPKGKPMTAREIIARGAEEYLNTKVDSNGKPTADGFYTAKQYTRLNRMLGEVIDRNLEKEMSGAVKSIKSQVQDEMRKAAAAWLAQFQKATTETLLK